MAQLALRDAQGRPLAVEQAPPSRNLRGEVLTGESAPEVWVRTLDGWKALLSITGAPIRNRQGQITGAVWLARDVTERRRLELYTQEALDALLAMAEALVQGPEEAEPANATSVRRPLPGTDPGLQAAAQRLAALTRSVLECQHVSIVAVEPGTGALTPITVVGLAPEDEQRWWASWDEHAYLFQHLHPSVVATLRAGEPALLDQTHARLPIWHGPSPARISLLVPMQIGETLVGMLRLDAGAKEQASLSPNKVAATRGIARLGALVLEHERLLRARAQAQANELALREAQAQMETFLAIAGHELKTPLTCIKLNLQFTRRRLEKLLRKDSGMPEELYTKATLPLQEFAHTGQQVAQLERLVNDVLDVSRVRAGMLDLHLEPTDLGTIVRQAVGEQLQAAPTRTLLRKNRRGSGNAFTGSRGSRSRATPGSGWDWGCTFVERLLSATRGGSVSRARLGRAPPSGLPCPWPPRSRRELPEQGTDLRFVALGRGRWGLPWRSWGVPTCEEYRISNRSGS